MGIFDKELEFSNQQAVTVSAASTNKVDLGPNSWGGNSMGAEKGVPIDGTIDESFTADGAGTLSVSVRSSNSSDMSGATTHRVSAAVGKASLVAGARLADLFPGLEIPVDAKRYVDLYYTVATGPMTAGKISLRGGTDRQTNR